MKKLLSAFMLSTALLLFSGCSDDAQVASHNLSKAADNFEIDRRVVFYNGITGEYMLTVEGKCSITDQGNQLEVVCRTGSSEYKKHFLGLSDNISYFAEQMTTANVNVYHHRVTFKPQQILPDIDFRGSNTAIQQAVTPDNKD